MQDDRLRDFLKFFRFHLAWFILSAGFFAVILISGLFLSTRYMVDTASQQSEIQPAPTPEELQLAAPEVPTSLSAPKPLSTPLPSIAPEPSVSPLPQTPPSISSKALSQPTPSQTHSVINQTDTIYTVKAGDSLWSIAEQVYGDGYQYKKISELNNISNPRELRVGQALKLSEFASITEQPRSQITDSAWSHDTTSYTTYTIVYGDSLWKIAEQELGDPYRWIELYQINSDVLGSDPDLIFAGTEIRIPKDEPLSSVSSTEHWTSSLLQ